MTSLAVAAQQIPRNVVKMNLQTEWTRPVMNNAHFGPYVFPCQLIYHIYGQGKLAFPTYNLSKISIYNMLVTRIATGVSII